LDEYDVSNRKSLKPWKLQHKERRRPCASRCKLFTTSLRPSKNILSRRDAESTSSHSIESRSGLLRHPVNHKRASKPCWLPPPAFETALFMRSTLPVAILRH